MGINFELREKMFLVFQETGSESQVRAQCAVHKKTIRKYRVIDKWDQRIQVIEQDVQVKLDTKIVNRRLRNVKVLDLAIEDIQGQLEVARAEGLKGIVDPKHLSRLVVAQDHLIGRGAADEENVSLTPEAQEALEFLKTLPPNAIVQLADYLANELQKEAAKPRGEAVNPILLPDTASGAYQVGRDYALKPKNENKPPIQTKRKPIKGKGGGR